MTRIDYLRFAVAAAVVMAAVVGVAAAVEVANQDVPEEAEVDEPTQATITLEKLYTDHSEWTLIASTELDDPRWNVTYYDQTGGVVESKVVESRTYNGIGISSEKDIARVVIQLRGTTPAVQGNYTYDGQNTFSILQLSQDPANGAVQPPFKGWETVHYTPESREARNALDEAKAAIDEARSQGVDVSEAESLFANAKSSYRSGNFENAKSLAQQAKESAQNAQNKSEQQSQQLQMIFLGVGAIVVLVIIGGGVYWYRKSQQKQTRLR